MRAALVADIHSNLLAFEAVLADAKARGGFDELWCLGDVVGYGPRPTECVDLLRSLLGRTVAGNHDLAAAGGMGVEEFNEAAAAAALWTARQLDDERRRWLLSLPQAEIAGDFTLVHGTLREPVWEYLLSTDQAADQLRRQQTLYSAVGHSHVAFCAVERAEGAPALWAAKDGDSLTLTDARVVVNPGGVGQPRDGDPRAAYALYDSEARAVTFHRVAYDVAAVQAQMRAAGLPRWLSERLAVGR